MDSEQAQEWFFPREELKDSPMDAPQWVEDDSSMRYVLGARAEKKPPVVADAVPRSVAVRRIRLLLVEDSRVDARLVQLSLNQVVGVVFEILMVTTAAQAVEQLAGGGFHLVLLDLGLPDSWGLDTLRKVREHAAAVPILVLTGNADEEVGVQAIRHGAQDYLVKGATAATLVRAIRYAMSRHRMRRKLLEALAAANASEANQRKIIEKNLDGVVVVDQEGLVVHANAAAEALFAYPSGKFLGQRFPLPVIPGTSRETDILNLNCQSVPAEIRCATIEWAGQPASLVLLRDLTEHRRSESNRHKLELARELQRGLLPQAPPNLTGFDIAGASVSADETGGDYFDYVPMQDGTIGIVVADASGHGIAAALLITVVSAYLRAFSSLTDDPGEVLRRVAQMLCPRIPEGSFITAVLARIDPLRRTLVYASAGHPSALVIDAAGQVRVDLFSLDLPIGLDPDAHFKSSQETFLLPGDTMLLLSDGMLEVKRHDDELFGKDRILEIVRQHRNEPAQVIVEKLILAVRSHCAPKSPDDDLTAVVIKVA